jgi:hypothetical protein
MQIQKLVIEDIRFWAVNHQYGKVEETDFTPPTPSKI